VVGNDVWFGYRTMVMPGIRIGHGAIIASGNPVRLIRSSYSEPDITRLLTLAWWDWPAEHLTQHLRTIMSGSIDDLEAIVPT
jgi:virginiamycin A acetyltransferase